MEEFKIQPKTVSLDGWLQPTTLHFQIVDVRRAHHNGVFIFVFDASKPVRELMKRLCMWGGPSVQHEEHKEALGYEVHKDMVPAVLAIVERTAADRPTDDPEAIATLRGFAVEHPASQYA